VWAVEWGGFLETTDERVVGEVSGGRVRRKGRRGVEHGMTAQYNTT